MNARSGLFVLTVDLPFFNKKPASYTQEESQLYLCISSLQASPDQFKGILGLMIPYLKIRYKSETKIS